MPAITHRRCTTNWSAFPPRTQEIQYDEKWAFVGKKQEHCDPDDPADERRGEIWDHVAFDPVHRLIVSAVPEKRTGEAVGELVADAYRRTEGRPMRLLTSDEYPVYRDAILQVYGETITPPRTGKRGRPRQPYKAPPADLCYATVHKTRNQRRRVVAVEPRLVYGTPEMLAQALEASPVSGTVNTAFLERQNGTDRHRNARKARKTYRFSKDWDVHAAMTRFTLFSYNFCWPVRTLRTMQPAGGYAPCTPAMAAGLADSVWSIRRWATFPTVQRS